MRRRGWLHWCMTGAFGVLARALSRSWCCTIVARERERESASGRARARVCVCVDNEACVWWCDFYEDLGVLASGSGVLRPAWRSGHVVVTSGSVVACEHPQGEKSVWFLSPSSSS